MIRTLLLFPLILCLLTGCSPKEDAALPPAATGFSCGITGTYRGEETAGQLTRTAAGLLTVSLTKPAELDGLTMEWNGETVTLRMLGLSWSLSPEDVPQAALGQRILGTLDTVVYGSATGEVVDGRLVTTGDAGDGTAFTLYSDPETGALLALEVPSEELSLTFVDFQKMA